ncbi:hypothetical protein KI372_03485 [Halobacterium salinarum]|nr:hypothetical protein [Halobacterium salinarum]MCF2240492.1 hypothetical protein [Halobacterium salinarum]
MGPAMGYATALQTLRKNYGPGTDRGDVTAGYTAMIAAAVAALLYVAAVAAVQKTIIPTGYGGLVPQFFAEINTSDATVLASSGLFVAAPAAFLIGFAGWRVFPPRRRITGTLLGGIGALLAYLGVSALGVLVIGVLSVAGFATFDVTLPLVFFYAGFRLTWWLTVPVGCLAGFVIASRGTPA